MAQKTKRMTITSQMLRCGIDPALAGPRCPNCGLRPMTRARRCVGCGALVDRWVDGVGKAEHAQVDTETGELVDPDFPPRDQSLAG